MTLDPKQNGMKKAMLYTVYLALWIFGLFTFAMMSTYLSDYLQSSGFFADTIIKPDSNNTAIVIIDKYHEWGARHYWYFWMCFFLFVIMLIRIGIWTAYYWNLNEEL